MKIKRIVRPGQPGTKKLVERYGDNLICVRYRYDAESKRTFKTIELVIESQPWQPNPEKIPMNKMVDLHIAVDEAELRNHVKKAGGKWNPQKQVWHLPYREVLDLGLTERIMD